MAKYLTKASIKAGGERFAPGVEVELTDEQAKSLGAAVEPLKPKAESKPEVKPEPKPEAKEAPKKVKP